MLQHLEGTEVAFAVGIQQETGLVDGYALADSRQRILQHAPGTTMHVHVTAGDQRQPEPPADFPQYIETLFLAPVGKQFNRDPQTIPKRLAYPVVFDIERKCVVRHPQHEAIREPVLEEASRQCIAALLCSTSGPRDKPAERSIAVSILRKCHQLAATLQSQLGTDDELEFESLCRHVRAHDAGHRTLVGDRERFIAEGCSRLHEFLGMRCTTQEREIAERMQFRVANPPHYVIRKCRANTRPPRHRAGDPGCGRPTARRRAG